jgi:hypothetical protein
MPTTNGAALLKVNPVGLLPLPDFTVAWCRRRDSRRTHINRTDTKKPTRDYLVGFLLVVPKVGEHTKWITEWILLIGADRFSLSHLNITLYDSKDH